VKAKADANWTTAGYGYDRLPGIQLNIGVEKVEKFTPNPIANGSFSVTDVQLTEPILTGSGQTGDYTVRIKMIAAYGPGAFGILSCCGSAVSVEVLATYEGEAAPSPQVPVRNLQKLCRPPCPPGQTYAFAVVPAQPAAGLFPAVAERPAEVVTCVVTADVELKEEGGNRDPVKVFVSDSLHADLELVRLVGSIPPSNTVTFQVVDAVTGTTLQEATASTTIHPMIPELDVDRELTRTTGLPGDRIRVTVIVRNANSYVALIPTVDVTLPANVTLDPSSVTPPAGPIPGGGPGLRWVAPEGPIPDGGVDRHLFVATINPLVPQDTVLPFTVSAQGIAEHPCVPGDTRQVNVTATKEVVVSPIRVGLDVDFTATPTRGCWPHVITYTARITNTGDIRLEQVTLTRLVAGTVGLPGNPPFPLALEPLGGGESRVVTYRAQIDQWATRRIPLVDVVLATGTAFHQGVQVAPTVSPVGWAAVSVTPPFIQSLRPPRALPGTSNLHLRISGFCFAPGATLQLRRSDGTELTGVQLMDPDPPLARWSSPIEMWQKISIAADAPPGEIQFIVTNPSGDVGGQPPDNVFVIGSQPRIAEIEPISAPALALITVRSANFGATIAENIVRFGNSPVEVVTLRNLGNSSLNVASVGSASPTFLVVPAAPFALPPTQGKVLTVTFRPASLGYQAGLISLEGNDPDQPVLEVMASGIGVPTPTPELSWEPAVLEFGSVPIGQSHERELTIRNDGEAILEVSSLSSSDPQFTALTSAPLQVAPNTAQPIRIRFQPAPAGLQQATLAVASNDADQGRVEVTLRGSGAQGQAPAALRFYCLSLRVPPDPVKERCKCRSSCWGSASWRLRRASN
jgi:hypothetical protein